jgi:hypothetical protein
LDSVSELDSALVRLATELVSDFHSASGSALASDLPSDLASESDSLAESDSAPEFDSASDFQSASPELLLQYPLLPVCVEFSCHEQHASE